MWPRSGVGVLNFYEAFNNFLLPSHKGTYFDLGRSVKSKSINNAE